MQTLGKLSIQVNMHSKSLLQISLDTMYWVIISLHCHNIWMLCTSKARLKLPAHAEITFANVVMLNKAANWKFNACRYAKQVYYFWLYSNLTSPLAFAGSFEVSTEASVFAKLVQTLNYQKPTFLIKNSCRINDLNQLLFDPILA